MYSIISELINKIAVHIEQNDESLLFHMSDASIYKMYHSQDCCEYVHIEDIEGDLNDLIGVPLLQAEESTSDAGSNDGDSSTWTFYKFATRKGYVTIRWYGTSNGYYSETAEIERIKDPDIVLERRMKLLKINEKYENIK